MTKCGLTANGIWSSGGGPSRALPSRARVRKSRVLIWVPPTVRVARWSLPDVQVMEYWISANRVSILISCCHPRIQWVHFLRSMLMVRLAITIRWFPSVVGDGFGGRTAAEDGRCALKNALVGASSGENDKWVGKRFERG